MNREEININLLLGNLLALIHRDGGHHSVNVGIEKSCEDAEKIILNRIRESENLHSFLDSFKYENDEVTISQIRQAIK